MDIHVHIHNDLGALSEVLPTLHRMEQTMADLTTSLADLQGAVQGVADRVTAGFGPLQDALAAAQQALTDFQAADAAEDTLSQASIDSLTAQLAEALGNASAAADSIEASVGQLNTIATSPPPPADPPVDPPVDPTPTDPAPPVDPPVDPAPVDPPVDPAPSGDVPPASPPPFN